jgi:hypothetical protein
MKSQKYFYKGRDFINIRKIAGRMTVIGACIFILILFAYINFASALNWQDKEWMEASCPNTAIGTWKSENPNFPNGKILNIQKNKISIIGNHNSEEKFIHKKSSVQVGGKFIEMVIQPMEQDKNIYLKIRPHLITSTRDQGNKKPITYNCMIKVFQFNSQKHAKFDKYSSWDIYQLKND